ncbi:BLUF domain-containing protein [Hymenobacter sp. BT186]|uniref:BLUF domain-containing protein n=1 Tax=Hymenobacter telluris TaxID=2816474 RepID=A0A939JAU5_9BACT|nr:BLUF domain-containing protein [Hymenobacter telluris]MBO0358481.1 BLUF domain-containing protein [Hymenobacter telluris]MBW3374507.1 BLUF domain-containing protein [Hymenobacter norwichensis]
MHHLIYSSSATVPFTDAALQELLTTARANNEQLQVTGVLLYHEGQFMQLLEGEASVIRSLYQVIEQDTRHTGIFKLADKPIEARSFSEWAMAFKPVDAEAFAQLKGYQNPAALDTAPQGLSGADALLLNIMRTFMVSEQE